MSVQGENGMKLMTEDFSEYRRYGSAVTSVNGLTPEDLVRLQNEGFVSVYSRYWRWWPVVRKNGVFGLLITVYRLFKMVVAKVTAKWVKFDRHPSLD